MENEVLYESMVSYNNKKFDTLLEVTDKKLIFSKKKGLFHKKYKVIDELLIDDIKVVNGKAKIKQKRNKVIIYTRDDKIEFSSSNIIETFKVMEKIINQRIGQDFIERATNRGKKVIGIATKVVTGTVGLAVGTVEAYKYAKKNKGKVKEAIRIISNLFIKKQ